MTALPPYYLGKITRADWPLIKSIMTRTVSIAGTMRSRLTLRLEEIGAGHQKLIERARDVATLSRFKQ